MTVTSYTTKSGDTWDTIAYELWGDEMLMADLIEANLTYADVVIFDAGIVLTVPEIVSVSGSLPLWKQ